MHPDVHSGTIHDSQVMEVNLKSIDRQMNKDVYIHIHIYTTEYY